MIRLGFTAACFTVALMVGDLSIMATWCGLSVIISLFIIPIVTHHYVFTSVK